MKKIEPRKKEEGKFHDAVRNKGLAESNQERFERLTSNRKFYSIIRASEEFKNRFLIKNCRNKKVLDYCCGNGPVTLFLAEKGANAYGVDISPVSIENCKKEAIKKGLDKNTHFFVMDAEKLEFEDNFFDLIVCCGVLHHLDVAKAYLELSRVLKPEGKIFCNEPLFYNPIFRLYRRMTPHLRTEWETDHILKKEDIDLASKYFNKIEKRFFHLFALIAVPFRDTFIFKPLLWILEKVDSFVLRLPFIKWWAWQIIFILSNPKKK